jgi:hypothetical protein
MGDLLYNTQSITDDWIIILPVFRVKGQGREILKVSQGL